METFIQNAKIYFSKVPLQLVDFKAITIGSSKKKSLEELSTKDDKDMDYTNPRISYKYFVDGDFDSITAILKNHNPHKYESLYSQFDVEKMYHDLSDDYIYVSRSAAKVDKTNFTTATSYYDNIRNTLDGLIKDPEFQSVGLPKFSLAILDLANHFTDDYPKKLLAKWYPFYLLANLQTYRWNIENNIDKNWVILNDNIWLQDLLRYSPDNLKKYLYTFLTKNLEIHV